MNTQNKISGLAKLAVALTAIVAVSTAQATLVVDFRATGATGNGTLVNSKSVTVSGAGGGSITFGVFVKASGADTTGANDEAGIIAFGATSYGGLVVGDATTGMSNFPVAAVAPWNGAGYQAGGFLVGTGAQPTGAQPAGATYFYDGDADRDVGGGAITSATNWIAVRAAGAGGFNGTTPGNPGTLVGEGFANAGMEWQIGTLTYTWLTTTAGTTNINAVLRNNATGISWKEDGATKNPTTVGTNALRGTDIVVSLLASGNDSQMLITSAPTNSSGATGASDKTINLGKVLFGGGPLTSGTMTVSKTGTNATTYTVTNGGSATNTFNNIGFVGGPDSVSGAISLNTGTPGVKNGTVTFDNTAADSAAPGQGSADGNDVFNVTGQVGASKAAQTPGPSLNSFVPGEALTAAVAASGSYAGLSSNVDDVLSAGSGYMAFGLANSVARIRGGVSSGGNTVSMNWRARNAVEIPGASTSPLIKSAPVGGLLSDVVEVTGMALSPQPGGNGATANHQQTDVFVLEMSYNPAAIDGSFGDELTAAANGFIYLGWLDPNYDGNPAASTSDRWKYAVAGNFYDVNHFQPAKGFVGIYQDYFEGLVSKSTIGGAKGANTFQLGDWGVDTSTGTVWAVVNHNSQFAVVPEPSTIAIFGAGLIGLVTVARRRRKAC